MEGVQGLPCRGVGCPQLFPSFSRRLRRRAKKKKKGLCADTPHPGQGLLPLPIPLLGVPEQSGMSHTRLHFEEDA